MPDRRSVVSLAAGAGNPAMEATLDELRESVGLASSLVVATLVSAESGVAKTGATTGTNLDASRASIDFEDARIDEVRLVVWGRSTTTGHSARVVDVTGGGAVTLCTVTLPSSNGYAAGDWTLIDDIGAGTRQLVLQVVGNASATQTLQHAALQMRTRRLIRR